MLNKGRARRPATLGEGATIVEPVYIEDGVTVEHSTVGPNVSVGAGSIIRHSRVRDAVIGDNTTIINSKLHDALIGDHVNVNGVHGTLNVGDHSDIRITPGA
jgi:glucose-1-phosphate thymidylyltransferase